MQMPFSFPLPFLICSISAGFIVLMVASISLILDLIKMRREHQEGAPSVWYRRPTASLSLHGLAFSVVVLVCVVGWIQHDILPTAIAVISMTSIAVVTDMRYLISDFRHMQRERRAGLPSVWFRRPKILKRFGSLSGFFSLLLWSLYGLYLLYALSRGITFHLDIRLVILGILVPFLFFLLSLAFSFSTAILQVRSGRSY